ncbi:MAG: hypothetical protein U1F27_04250 [Turneriella sp.]
MRVLPAGFGVLVLLLAALIKIAAMLEYGPLYNTLQFFPAQLAAIISGQSHTEAKGIYRFTSFVLDYSCAGVNFLLLCLVAGAWLFRNRIQSLLHLAVTTAGLLLAAWLATNIANAFRIGLSLRLMHISGRYAWMHEAIGTIVFCVFLLSYYQLLLRFSNDKTSTTR